MTGHLTAPEPTLYEQCHALHCRARRLDRLGADETAAHVRRHMGYLQELYRRRLEEIHGPSIVVLPPEPRHVEAEQIVIGAALARYYPATVLRLRPGDFWQPLHAGCWSALIDPAAARLGAETLERSPGVPAGLTAQRVVEYLLDLRDRVWPGARYGVRIWAAIVREMSRRRRLLRAIRRLEAELC